jgi:hypothetical protein
MSKIINDPTSNLESYVQVFEGMFFDDEAND